VSGQASTFEANVEWELRRAGAPIASGSTTATIAAPARGTYSFRTEPLGPGNYSVVVLERSAKDGSVTASWQIPFSVR
ncbi:Gmad2 immunoglobulin-like domain-containing protein, partial [Intrasporangium oryzae]|uniref:Gmad2 immunoglobulin-like domain-containing protein n=1 Tax=Intrasporangium oryzae TaxID=412687 RepID=UPI000556DF6C